jgi:O-antigen ligase
LDQYTGGTLSTRYQDFDLTNRDLLIQADLQTFWANPIFGIGPGQSKYEHEVLLDLSNVARDHTEYSRVLAEHGSLGLLSLLLLIVMSAKRIFRRNSPLKKAIIVSFTVWTILYMFHSATRLAAPSVIFGLGSVFLDWDDAV